MGSLGLVEIILILVSVIPGLVIVAGGVFGFIAFLKLRRIESSLKSKGLL